MLKFPNEESVHFCAVQIGLRATWVGVRHMDNPIIRRVFLLNKIVGSTLKLADDYNIWSYYGRMPLNELPKYISKNSVVPC